MIGKLVLYEIRKSLGTKFVLLSVLALLILNAVPFEASGRGQALIMREEFTFLTGLSELQRSDFEASMEEKYGKDILGDLFFMPTEEMMAVPGYFGDRNSDLDFILDMRFLREENARSRAVTDSVLEAAEAHGRAALRSGDGYGVRRNRKIIRLYSAPRREITCPVRGWDGFLFGDRSVYPLFLLILLICAGSFAAERDRRTGMLLEAAKYGRGRTMAAKYISGGLIALLLTLLFWLTSLVRLWYANGFAGGEQPVAALDALAYCPYPFTLWQYALAALGCRAASAVFLSVLLNTVSAWSRVGTAAYGAGILLGGASVGLMLSPPRAEWLAGPLALAEPLRFFGSYYTANLFGFPVPWFAVQAALWTAVCGVCIAVTRKVCGRKRRRL